MRSEGGIPVVRRARLRRSSDRMDTPDARGPRLRLKSAAGVTVGRLLFGEFGNLEVDGLVPVRKPISDVFGDILERRRRVDRQSEPPEPQKTSRMHETDGGERLLGLAQLRNRAGLQLFVQRTIPRRGPKFAGDEQDSIG